MKKSIPYGRQSISWRDALAVGRSARSGLITMGPAVDRFESDLKAVTGASFAAAVSSGSAALHCAYAAIGLGPGDEIITSPLTFASTATTAINLGASVVFCDVQADSGNIDPSLVESLITKRTRAIVAVDYAGQPAELDELKEICQRRGIVLIEDAAHSIGSTYKNRAVGSIADITTFSFFPTKGITTGEGGAVLTNNSDFDRGARLFRSHGIVRDEGSLIHKDEGPWHQEVASLGLNYRLSDIHATLGSSQVARIRSFKSKRRKIFDWYQEHLSSHEELVLPMERPYVSAMWHLYPVRVPEKRRRSIFESLRNQGVMVQVNYLPVYQHPVFGGRNPAASSCPRAESYYRTEISLPMHPNLSTSDLKRISNALFEALR